MGGRTMPTECVHGKDAGCLDCRYEMDTRNLVRAYPAEAVAQLVADGVLVATGWRRGDLSLSDPRQRAVVERSRPEGDGWMPTYGVVLPEEGE